MKIQSAIEQKIQATLSPTHFEVINESHRHRGPADRETHFKLTVVSSQFENLGLVERHRQIYDLLKAEMGQGVHALALHLFSPAEWAGREKSMASPPCASGPKG
jgi:BolA protein